MSKTDPGTLEEVRDWLVDPQGGPRESRGSSRSPKVGPGDPRVDSCLVGGTTGRSGTGWGTLGEVRGTLEEVRRTLVEVQKTLKKDRGTVSEVRGTRGEFRGTIGEVRGTIGEVGGLSLRFREP